MNCEICGLDSEVLYVVIYLGARTYACRRCVDKHGLTIIKRLGEQSRKTLAASFKTSSSRRNIKNLKLGPDFELVEGYGEIVKRKREEMGLTQEELAQKLKVKLSYIKKIEAGKIVPEYNVVLKLEKILNVKLIETSNNYEDDVKYAYVEEPEEGTTLGDIMFRGKGGE